MYCHKNVENPDLEDLPTDWYEQVSVGQAFCLYQKEAHKCYKNMSISEMDISVELESPASRWMHLVG